MIEFVHETLLLLPFLFATYLVLEAIEAKAGGALERWLERARSVGPLAGALAGAVPQCGVSADEMSALHKALDDCVVYKAATPSFIHAFNITNYSGLSMYLPCAGTSLLNSIYMDEPWNKAVGLVK